MMAIEKKLTIRMPPEIHERLRIACFMHHIPAQEVAYQAVLAAIEGLEGRGLGAKEIGAGSGKERVLGKPTSNAGKIEERASKPAKQHDSKLVIQQAGTPASQQAIEDTGTTLSIQPEAKSKFAFLRTKKEIDQEAADLAAAEARR